MNPDTLYTECDISADRTWSEQYHCGLHGVWFRDGARREDVASCPVGEFALAVAKRHPEAHMTPTKKPKKRERVIWAIEREGSIFGHGLYTSTTKKDAGLDLRWCERTWPDRTFTIVPYVRRGR